MTPQNTLMFTVGVLMFIVGLISIIAPELLGLLLLIPLARIVLAMCILLGAVMIILSLGRTRPQ